MSHQAFFAQSEVIRELADEGPCVIVGRCADYALADNPCAVTVFISGYEADRLAYLKDLYNVTEAKAKDIMIKTDKQRASYYNYYANKKWGDARSYDLCINSSVTGIDGAVQIIQDFSKIKMANRK